MGGQRVDSGWTEQVDRVDRGLSTLDKKSSMISIGYHLLFSTLSSIATWEKFSIFLSAWNPVPFSTIYYIIFFYLDSKKNIYII